MLPIFEFLKDIFFCAGYLAHHNAFPAQLTNREETELVARCQAGDEAARSALIEHNLRLAAHIAKKYAKNNSDLDDFVSIGTIGLIKGINTFQNEKGKLSTYVSRCIENAIPT